MLHVHVQSSMWCCVKLTCDTCLTGNHRGGEQNQTFFRFDLFLGHSCQSSYIKSIHYANTVVSLWVGNFLVFDLWNKPFNVQVVISECL